MVGVGVFVGRIDHVDDQGRILSNVLDAMPDLRWHHDQHRSKYPHLDLVDLAICGGVLSTVVEDDPGHALGNEQAIGDVRCACHAEMAPGRCDTMKT